MKGRFLGLVLLVIALILMFWKIQFNITGNVVGDYFGGTHSAWHLLGIVLLALSVFLLNSKREGLEYLVIPTGWEEDRIPRAKKELDMGRVDKVIITGHVDKGMVKGSHREKIYKAMREYGLKPSEMKILDGIDTEEDILYLGKMLKKGDGVTFDTFPLHYQEYRTLIKKAKKGKQFPKGVRIKNASTRQGIKETIYGFAGWGEEVLKNRRLSYVKDRKKDLFSGVYSAVKEGVKKILR